MNRRGFLSSLVVGGAGTIVAPVIAIAAPKIWVPEEQSEKSIKIAKSLVPEGMTIYGYWWVPEERPSFR